VANELNESSEANPNQAAEQVVSDFFKEHDREEAASRETGPSAPVYGEVQQQADELEQDGQVDPRTADGTPEAAPTPATEQKPTPEASKEAPELDDDLRSIAKEFGWADAKIDRLVKADPELARETFETFAATLAEQARQFLPGGPGSPAPRQPIQSASVPPSTPQPPALPPELSDDALKAFAEENGEQAAKLIKLIRDNYVVKQDALEERLVRAEQAAQVQELKAVAAEASTVIAGLSGKHPKLYGEGDNVNVLTVEQYNRRVELTMLADQIRLAAGTQGRSMTVTQALTNAHYVLSRDSVKSEARQEVAAAVQRRSKQAVAKPTARVNPEGRGQKRTNAGAAEAYSRRLAELGIE